MTDKAVQIVATELYFLPVRTRVPLKFGAETLTEVTCARARVRVRNRHGREAEGWGETPLNVQWVWPSALSYAVRHNALADLCVRLAAAWARFGEWGHALEVGHRFLEDMLPGELAEANAAAGTRTGTSLPHADPLREDIPRLAALACCSPFDQALHDAYGNLCGVPTYDTYNREHLSRDLATYLEPADNSGVHFSGKFPSDFLTPRRNRLPAWHLVGGNDLLEEDERTGSEPEDGYPVTLREWIRRDGLACLKVKLRGNDPDWDYGRLERVGRLALEEGVRWLSADFNCTVQEPDYVNEVLDRLMLEQPRTYDMLLYIEQPFPYDLEAHRLDVHGVSARKPLFMDESAHDWRLVRLGRELGWTGVALKTCKTQTGALLSLCWARAHGMALMVQDLTNPMLAQIPHVLLAAHAGTIMGVETNAMQFYPEASGPEAVVHPGLYRRRGGEVDLSTLGGTGFGYRVGEITRELPPPAAVHQLA
ncbi:MAG: enolase C-terminal domain-like protein [Candidatus Hydrogenedentales bacterium]